MGKVGRPGGRCALTQMQMESELIFSFSFNPGVIYSFLIVGRTGFSKALFGLLEKCSQEILISGGGGGGAGLGTLEEGCPGSSPPVPRAP